MQGVARFLIITLLQIYQKSPGEKISKSINIWKNYDHEFGVSIFPPHLIFSPPADHACVINAFIVLSMVVFSFFGTRWTLLCILRGQCQ